MPELFRITPAESAEIVELLIPQMLDSQEFDALNVGLLQMLEQRRTPKWILDLSGVPYAGSALLGLMVNVRQRVKTAGGKLVLCGLSPVLADIFKTSSLIRLFTIVRDRPTAIREMNF